MIAWTTVAVLRVYDGEVLNGAYNKTDLRNGAVCSHGERMGLEQGRWAWSVSAEQTTCAKALWSEHCVQSETGNVQRACG